MEWVEGRKDLEAEKAHSRDLVLVREAAVAEARQKVEVAGREVGEAKAAAAAAESRAKVLEVRVEEREAEVRKGEEKLVLVLGGGGGEAEAEASSPEAQVKQLRTAVVQLEKERGRLKEEVEATKGHADNVSFLFFLNPETLKPLNPETLQRAPYYVWRSVGAGSGRALLRRMRRR